MRKKNLFLVNTPFHLLTSFILMKGSLTEGEQYLLLLHPQGYEKWSSNPILSYMMSTACGYQDVFPLVDWLSGRKTSWRSYRQQVAELRHTIGKLGIDDIYLGCDIDVQNQLLVAALGKDCFYRYEDGLYSYYNEDRRRPWSHMSYHKWRLELIRKMTGMKGRVVFNTSTASDSKSGRGDFMYWPELLQRYSPEAYEIKKKAIDKAVEDLQQQNLLHPVLQESSVLYLSQPLVEQKKFTIEEEKQLLQEILLGLGTEYQLLYKPHPNDSADKIAYYQKALPEMRIFNRPEPVELSFACEENLQAVISYQSTALLLPSKFGKKKITAISLANFYREPLHSAYQEIMQGAGVLFPRNTQEIIEEIFSSAGKDFCCTGRSI